ncbi:hypothetical protein [Staphylococcus delphini]|uniref:hypothetical protein n=1 Tax=Staphylococcus delphini TaxID=53344 RepID=UPI0021D30F77|nr:hypothetical protein [Staphylococcus delphini]UXS58035.1 hypothetical protein MUA44_02320 [Staphylococcus delphini]
MQKFHYKEHFWDVTKKIMTVFNDKDEPVYQLKLGRGQQRFKLSLLFNYLWQEYEIADGENHFYLTRDKGGFSWLLPTWQVYHNEQYMGRFRASYLLPIRFYYDTAEGDRFKFKFRFFTYNAEVRDASGRDVMSVDASIFKLKPEYRIEIHDSMIHPALLILLFQAGQEFISIARKSH